MHAPRSRRRAASAAALTLVAILLWPAAATDASHATPLNKNLLKNGGAESGRASPDGNEAVPVPGWTVGNGFFTVVKYGTSGGFPTHSQSQINGRKQFFSAGVGFSSESGQECDGAYQDVNLNGRDAGIDSGHLWYDFKVYMATYGNQIDTANFQVDFYSATWGNLGSQNTGHASATNGQFRYFEFKGNAPVGTRHIEVAIWASHAHQGPYCDAYFDNLSLKLIPNPT